MQKILIIEDDSVTARIYRAVLEKIYPDREIRAALLWTDSLDLVEVPAPTLDAALIAVLDR